MGDSEYSSDVTKSIKERYLERERTLAGLQNPAVRGAYLRGAPKETLESLQAAMNAQGQVQETKVAPKTERQGVFGFMERNVGRPIGFVFSQAVPAWAEFVSDPVVGAWLKSSNPEGYAKWQAAKLEEGLSWNQEVAQFGLMGALSRGIRRQAAARKGRGDLFILEKLAGEIVLDPTTYMGWGIATKLAKTTHIAALALGDTLPQAAWKASFGRAGQVIRSGAGLTGFGPAVQEITRIATTPSRATAISRAGATAEQVIREALGSEAILKNDRQAVKRLIQQLQTIKKTGGEFPEEAMLGVRYAHSQSVPEDLVQHLAEVGQTLDEYDGFMAAAGGNPAWAADMYGMTPAEVISYVNKAGQGVAAEKWGQAFQKWKESNHLAQRLAVQAIDPDIPWLQKKLVKAMVVEPARAMLLFANYGPMNVMEDAVRAMGGGHRPTLANPEVFNMLTSGEEVVPGLREGLAFGSEGVLSQRAIGVKNVKDAPFLAHLGIPPAKRVANTMYRWNLYMQEGGSMIRRGHYLNVETQGLKEGLVAKGLMDSPEVQAVVHLTKAGPKWQSPALRDANKAIEIAALKGDSNLLRALPQQAFNKRKIAVSDLEQVLGKYGTNLPEDARLAAIEAVARGPVDPDALEDVMRQKLLDNACADPQTFAAVSLNYTEKLKAVLADPNASPDEVVAVLDGMWDLANYMTHTPGRIATHAAKAGGRAGTNLERAAGAIEEAKALSNQVLGEWADIMDGAAAKVPSSWSAEAKKRFPGHYAKFRDTMRRLREEQAIAHQGDTAIRTSYFPEAMKGKPYDYWSKEFTRIRKGEVTVQASSLPSRVKAVLLRDPKEPISGAFYRARGLGVGSSREASAISNQEYMAAFWEAQHEERNELWTKFLQKAMYTPSKGRKTFNAAGPRTMDYGYYTGAQASWAKDVDATRKAMQGKDSVLADIINNSEEVANRKLAEMQDPLVSKSIEAELVQKTMVWDRAEQQITTIMDELKKKALAQQATENEIAAFSAHVESVASAVDRVNANPARQALVRQNSKDAAAKALEAMKNDFTNYSDEMVFEPVMKTMFPFWTYQSRSWPWMLGQAVRHPGMSSVFAPHGKLAANTDEGYISTPVLGLQVNPLRGTVFNRMRRAFRSPYPDRFTGSLGRVDSTLNKYLERYGFYPGLHMTIPLEAMAGLLSGSTGKDMASILVESMPALPASAVEGLVASSAYANPEWTVKLSDTLFPSKFREYYMAKALWDMHKVSVSQAKEQGHDDWIGDAYQRVALFNIVENQLSMTRFNPQSWQELEQKKMAMVQELTGLSVEEQVQLKKDGKRVSDVVALSRLDREKLHELEGYDAMVEATRPLSEGLRQEYMQTLEDKYDSMDKLRKNLLEEQQEDDWRLEHGWLTGDGWRNNYYDRWQEYRALVDGLAETEYFGKLGRTPTEQQAVREKLQFTTGMVSPVDLVIDAMYSMSPSVDVYGNMDWSGMFEAQEQLLNVLEPETKKAVQDYLARNSTPMMQKFREGRTFMGAYWRADKAIGKWYTALGQPEAATEIAAQVSLVKQNEMEIQQSLSSGVPYDVAKSQKYNKVQARLNRHIQEIRWRMAYDPSFKVDEEIKYDPRVADYLTLFYGNPPAR